MEVTLAALLCAVGLGIAATGLVRTRHSVAAAASVEAVVESGPWDAGEPTGTQGGGIYRALEPVLTFVAHGVRRVSPAGQVERLRQRIVYAGLEGELTLDQQFVRKGLCAVAGLVFGFLFHPHSVPGLVAGLILGALASIVPDLTLSSKATKRQLMIARALPDALDLLAITVEAGLGLEQAISVVAEKMSGPLGDELRRTLREIELGVDRRQALIFLRDRTDVPELSAFVVSLLQAEELGVAISQVLKVQAGQVRLIRRQRAREQAAKTPIKILFPMIFGIFPALFVVTIGPGAISIIKALSGLH